MPRSPQDLYARLLSSARGYPLWTPDPSNEFLRERPEGLRIGDVGVVIDDGGFDALFNLCLPPNHPFHTRFGVPDSFTCFRPEELEIRTRFSAEPDGRVILTPSVIRLGFVSSTEAPERDELGVSNYRFNLSSDQGALLILPEGAERHELLNDGIFVQKASQNGAEWYHYAQNRRHRIISQDALYVITGLYKTRSWSIAAFENVAENESYAAHYKHIPDRNSTARRYGWETTRASFDQNAGTSIDHGSPSQTVFIRGLKIALRSGFFGTRWVSVEADTPSMARSNPVKSLSVVPSNLLGDIFASLIIGDRGSTSRTTIPTWRSTDAAEEQAQSEEGMHVEIQQVPDVPPAFHPSNAINQYLLRKDPSANIAITCDSIWMSILEEKLLTTEEFDEDFRLETVLSQNYNIVSYEGVVRLERKRGTLVDRQTRSRSSTPPISDPNSTTVQSVHVSPPPSHPHPPSSFPTSFPPNVVPFPRYPPPLPSSSSDTNSYTHSPPSSESESEDSSPPFVAMQPHTIVDVSDSASGADHQQQPPMRAVIQCDGHLVDEESWNTAFQRADKLLHVYECFWDRTHSPCGMWIEGDQSNVADHLALFHGFRGGKVTTRCLWRECPRPLMKGMSIARHVVTHIGFRVNCNACKHEFARVDAYNRAHSRSGCQGVGQPIYGNLERMLDARNVDPTQLQRPSKKWWTDERMDGM